MFQATNHTCLNKSTKPEKEQPITINLEKGSINPWNIDFCIHNFLCTKIFQNKWMTTNNARLTEGVFFKTEALLNLKSAKVLAL